MSGKNADEDIANLKRLVRESSLITLRSFSGNQSLKIEQMKDQPVVLGHWLTMLLAAGNGLSILFQVYFQSSEVKDFARNIYGKRKSVSKMEILDYFKEYCNLTGGHLKRLLATNGIEIEVSLPIVARGFDDLFYVYSDATISDVWCISAGHGRIICSLKIDLNSKVQIQNTDPNLVSSTGDVEFL